MPSCIQLFRKSDPEPREAVRFQEIDEELCRVFDQPCDPKYWLWGWYDNICLFLSLGKSFDYIRDLYKDCPEIIKVCDYLEEHYTPNSWYEMK
jgi:hypothetical protein